MKSQKKIQTEEINKKKIQIKQNKQNKKRICQ